MKEPPPSLAVDGLSYVAPSWGRIPDLVVGVVGLPTLVVWGLLEPR
ncbi:MAG: hypothetical protein ACQETI_03455 [Halobacteriota archaeon]